jgi:hypothetical protein
MHWASKWRAAAEDAKISDSNAEKSNPAIESQQDGIEINRSSHRMKFSGKLEKAL